MPLTERERHDAYEALRGTFGEQTDVVIQLLRPDHENLVTKDDLAVTTAVLRTEVADLRTELKTEIADLRTELKTEMADLRTDLRADMAQLRVDFAGEINAAFAAQTRMLVIGLVSAVLLIALSNTISVLLG